MEQQLKQGEWVLNVSNHFRWHYVYLFSLVIKAGQWVLHKIDPIQFPDWEDNHTIRVKDGRVIEMLANGKNTEERIEDWIAKQNRTVKVLRPLVPFVDTPPKPYDFWGIPQIMLSYFRKYILRRGNTWNGTDGVPKDKDGFTCVEEALEAIGEENACIGLPCRVRLSKKLVHVGTIITKSK